MRHLIGQLGWFVAVGCAASATHWLTAVLVVSYAHLTPLIANIAGWLAAFVVSFTGHYHLTFRHGKAPIRTAARRFFAVSALGFAVNEASYAFLLNITPIRYDILLAMILIGIAAMTFVLGRFWAFHHRP
ncbi:GtrA family protein [Pusillimonas sp. TS35]|uniref:GtrA family protein n=1 Tax=Paracandidimonas lactea TaxID=2895524 RepID=UPI0013700AD0|nr:GtrA family protein [Paracandidimonas lactea]MYN14437.1 GtrA family protein [Pusillimonas sp. TS35]